MAEVSALLAALEVRLVALEERPDVSELKIELETLAARIEAIEGQSAGAANIRLEIESYVHEHPIKVRLHDVDGRQLDELDVRLGEVLPLQTVITDKK
jgi:hypothetical protein